MSLEDSVSKQFIYITTKYLSKQKWLQ